jgi:hypothetical protein
MLLASLIKKTLFREKRVMAAIMPAHSVRRLWVQALIIG